MTQKIKHPLLYPLGKPTVKLSYIQAQYRKNNPPPLTLEIVRELYDTVCHELEYERQLATNQNG